jgi:hypothetical protein
LRSIGKLGRGQRGRAERVLVDPRVRLLQPLDLAAQRRRERVQVMRERRRLCLHAMRVGGDDRFRVPVRQGEQPIAGGHQSLEFLEQPVAQVQARDGRRDVLAAATTVKARGLLARGGDELRFVIQVVGRAPRGRSALLLDHPRHPLRDRGRYRARHDPGLVEHDDRRLVDLVEELDRAPAATEHFVDVQLGHV